MTAIAVSSEPRSPRGQARREAIIKAAIEVFLERGYEGTSLDMVIERAGGSRRTIYEAFGNKEGLFGAIVAQVCSDILGKLAALDESAETPEAALTSIGATFLGVLISPHVLALYRVVVAESARFPELGATFLRFGPDAAYTRLGVYLREQTKAGALMIEDPETSARQFLESVKGDLHLRALLQPERLPAQAEIERQVQVAIAVFLRGVERRT